MAEGTATGKMNYVTWDDEMDIAMLEVLVHHHNMGDHSQNGWKAHVYIVAIKNVKKKCNKDIAKDNILGRLRTFDKQFEVINKILSQSGFGWDWVNHKLSIDSDDVWTKYLEEAISTIYSKYHADGEGAKIVAETTEDLEEPIEISPETVPKRQRIGNSIMCIIGEMRTTFKDALKTTDPLPLPKVTTPFEILPSLELIPELAEVDMLRSYGKLILYECLFEALMELPMQMRKAWLLLWP
uniref:Myb/SANT-like domain-containing protein n=1 Tax=Aegilops tauschii TaxID=37682 RepID=R7W4R9_AEGTA